MTTATAPAARQPRRLEPARPDVELQAYCVETGLGVLRIDGTAYAMGALRHAGRTVGVRLARCLADGTIKRIDVDLTASPHACDCEDATFRPGRPGGCKHVAALRLAADQLRGRATA